MKPARILSCPECKGKRRVRSGCMVVHPRPALSSLLGLMRKGVAVEALKSKPILMVHPEVYEQLKPLIKGRPDASPRDQLVASMIASGELTVEVSKDVPLWIDCRTCCAPTVNAKT